MASERTKRSRRGAGSRTSFLARGARQDPDAFGRLYERAAPAVFAWASLRIRPAMRALVDPEDVVQEVWCRALRRLGDFDPKTTPFRPWLFRIANNVLLEAFKRLRPRLRSGGAPAGGSRTFGLEAIPADITSVSRRVAREEALLRFMDEVAGLPDEERRLLLYRGLEGLEHVEVAERMGIGAAAARKRWERLRAKLEALGIPDGLVEG